MRRRARLAAFLVAVLVGVGVATVPPAGASAPVRGLDLFVHPGVGGGWASHTIVGVTAGASVPALTAVGGDVVLAQEAEGGDLVVADGTLWGPFTESDLSQTDGAPQAIAAPAAVSVAGAVWVVYRTSTGDLEAAERARGSSSWTLTDVTTATGGPELAGNPFAMATPSGPAVFAVATGGVLEEFLGPLAPAGTWVAVPVVPTSCPLLAAADVAAFTAPDTPAATVVLAVGSGGDLVELSDDATSPAGTVGSWVCTDLSQLGAAPQVSGELSAIGGTTPYAAYGSWGQVEAATVTSGLPGGVHVQGLSSVDDLWPSSPFAPTVVEAPGGPEVAQPSTERNLLLEQISPQPGVSNLTFQPRTTQKVMSAVASTLVGSAMALVATDGGVISTSPRRTRIALLAASFDQQHARYQTTPAGSDCNRFTAWWGRGSTAGCPRGTSSEAWCSDFASYVWAAAGVPVGGIDGWAASFVTWGAQHHLVQWGTRFRAAVGDAIVWGQRSPLYGQHVGIIVWVSADGSTIDVVSGNSGGDYPGYGVGVWRWGAFVGSTSTVLGYPVLGIVAP